MTPEESFKRLLARSYNLSSRSQMEYVRNKEIHDKYGCPAQVGYDGFKYKLKNTIMRVVNVINL